MKMGVADEKKDWWVGRRKGKGYWGWVYQNQKRNNFEKSNVRNMAFVKK